MGIEYAVIEGPRSEGGSVWVCGTDAVGGGEARRGCEGGIGICWLWYIWGRKNDTIGLHSDVKRLALSHVY